METIESLKSEYDLDFLTQKSIEVFLGSWSTHVLRSIIMSQGDGFIVQKRCKLQSKNLNLTFDLLTKKL